MRSDVLTLGNLVADARDGDKHAWDQIVEQCTPLIWSICRRYRLSPAEAEDVSQNVWLHLVQGLGSLREPEKLPGWLATATRRECSQLLGAVSRKVISGYSPDPDTVPDERLGSAEQGVLLAERNTLLREAFATLSPRHQRLLIMLIQDPPVSYAKISEELGLKPGSIGSLRKRCLDALREYPPLSSMLHGESGPRQGTDS